MNLTEAQPRPPLPLEMTQLHLCNRNGNDDNNYQYEGSHFQPKNVGRFYFFSNLFCVN